MTISNRLAAILTAAIIALSTSCASSTGAFLVGPDTYRVTSTAFTSMGGEATAKKKAYSEATAQCAQLGQPLLVTNEDKDVQFTGASVTVTFRCDNGTSTQ